MPLLTLVRAVEALGALGALGAASDKLGEAGLHTFRRAVASVLLESCFSHTFIDAHHAII